MQVRKDDGALEPFALPKVARSISLALGKQAEHAPEVVHELALAVELQAANLAEQGVVDSHLVLMAVLKILDDAGLDQQAARLLRHARRRELMRERLRVVRLGKGRTSEARPFSKKLVVAHLRSRHGLGESVARLTASNVEDQLMRSRYGTVTTAYLAELMNNELLAWGLVGTDLPTPLAAASEPEAFPKA